MGNTLTLTAAPSADTATITKITTSSVVDESTTIVTAPATTTLADIPVPISLADHVLAVTIPTVDHPVLYLGSDDSSKTQAVPMKVMISVQDTYIHDVEYDAKDADHIWSLIFNVDFEVIKFNFVVTELYTQKLSSWRSLAAGSKIKMSLYQGNGTGIIQSDGTNITFKAAPSGAGGDVRSTYVIAHKYIAQGLTKALDTAVAAGFSFRPE